MSSLKVNQPHERGLMHQCVIDISKTLNLVQVAGWETFVLTDAVLA